MTTSLFCRKKSMGVLVCTTLTVVLVTTYTSMDKPIVKRLMDLLTHEQKAMPDTCEGVLAELEVDARKLRDGSPLFHSELLKEDAKKLSVEYLHSRRIIRDLLNHLHSSLTNSSHYVVLLKSREHLWIMEYRLQEILVSSGVKNASEAALKSLRRVVYNAIHSLQNPMYCKTAPKLVCEPGTNSGFAAGLDDILWCFVVALQTGRTLILSTAWWEAAPAIADWFQTLMPIAGDACAHVSVTSAPTCYPSSAPFRRDIVLNLPSRVVEDLVAYHGEPYAWWFGHIVGYILRLRESTRENIKKEMKLLDYRHPIAGIHIQRNKGNDTVYHKVKQYMDAVEDFYERITLKKNLSERRVFVATDEAAVITELEEMFTNYTFISKVSTGRDPKDRSGHPVEGTLFSEILNLYLLAESDFLVCAFSSRFCRVAYELMQTLESDASFSTTSVDVDYFYANVPFPSRRALYNSKAHRPKELSFNKGQLIEKHPTIGPLAVARQKPFAGGYQYGWIQNAQAGWYPTFKTVQTYRTVDYHTIK